MDELQRKSRENDFGCDSFLPFEKCSVQVNKIRLGALSILALIAAFAMVPCFRYYVDRPMFATHFGDERQLIPSWNWNRGFQADTEGLGLVADEHLNLIVVFRGFQAAGEPKAPQQFGVVRSKWNDWRQCIIIAEHSETKFPIPRTRNTLVIVETNGKQTSYPIASKLAIAINQLQMLQNREKLSAVGLESYLKDDKR